VTCNGKEGEYVLVHSMKAYRRGVIAQRFLTSALDGCKRPTSHPGCFTPWGKNSRHPLNHRTGRPQNWSELSGEESIFSLSESELQIFQVLRAVIILTRLFGLFTRTC